MTDPTDVQVNVQVSTTGTNDAVLVMSQTYPQVFSTAATRSSPGLLALVQQAGTAQSITVQYGSLNGDGTATLSGTGTLTVSLSGTTPVVTPGADIPVDWVFGTPVQQTDGSWLLALSDVPATPLKVMGARTEVGAPGYCVHRQVLVALDPVSLLPVTAQWQYVGEDTVITTERFTDTLPGKRLMVSGGEGRQDVTLNESNIVGAGDTGSYRYDSLAARLNDGTVTAWGYADYGGTPPVSTANHDVVQMAGGAEAFGAINADGQAMAWGNPLFGGSISSDVADMTDIISVTSANNCFMVLRENGQVATWGETPGSWSPVINGQSSVWSVTGNSSAFAELYGEGQVTGWGDPRFGGIPPSDIANLTDIVSVTGGSHAFAALRAGGSLVAWGDASSGGSVPSDISDLTDIVSISGGAQAFAALQAGGNLVAWGNTSSGGNVPSEIGELKDIVNIIGSGYAFAALRANGKVVAWGNASYGGDVPEDIAALTDIVSITGSGWAFSALRATGEVVAWGSAADGGAIPDSVTSQLNGVRAIYAAVRSFCALKEDNTVVVWGSDYAGNMNNIPATLQGNISYEMSSAT